MHVFRRGKMDDDKLLISSSQKEKQETLMKIGVKYEETAKVLFIWRRTYGWSFPYYHESFSCMQDMHLHRMGNFFPSGRASSLDHV